MFFSCNRENLLNNINIVLKGVSNKSTLPILECILITVYKNNFKLTSNNLELGIETNLIEADVKEEGKIAIEAKIFFDIIKKLNGTTITLKKDEHNNLVIKSKHSKFKISIIESNDFPSIPVIKKENEYIMYQNDLKNMIKQTIFSIAQDESKPILTGELIEIYDKHINIVSVDGYRISYKKSKLIKDNNNNTSVIIPGKILNEISKILSNDPNEEISIFIGEKHVLFDLGICIIVSRVIEGEYIKYKQSFFDDFKTKIFISRTEFIAGLERAILISRDVKKIPVKLEIKENKIIINSNSELGTSYEELTVECDGDNLNIAFNPKYLIDALKVIEEDKISIQFTTSLSPCIITSIEYDDYKYLILPLRI